MNIRSIRVRLLGMMTLITVGFGVYLTRDIAANFFALQESGRIVAVSEVAVAGSALVHELQKERGLSADFIASRGERFRSELDRQRSDSDQKRQLLEQWLAATERAELGSEVAAALGEVEKQLAGHTFAVSVDGEMFIRSVAALGADKTAFFCDIEFGDTLHLLKITDFVSTTQRDWQQFLSGKGAPQAMLLNDCVLRRVGNAAVLGRASFFADTPAAGFSTFGEILGIPINQNGGTFGQLTSKL